jgi:hypothetical protein
MSTKQPKALRLANELVLVHQGHADEGPSTFSEAAAELRRLHSVNADLLEFAKEWLDRQGTDENYMVMKARAAIAKANGR